MKKYFIAILLCGFYINLLAQNTLLMESKQYTYSDTYANKNYNVENYLIQNNTNEEYLIWFSAELIEGKSTEKLIHEYFIQRKGDFSLLQIMYENLMFPTFDVSSNLIIKLLEGESFNLILLKKHTETSFYKDRLVKIKRKDVEDYLKLTIDEKYYFPSKVLVINEMK